MNWLRELLGVSLAGLSARKMRTALILLGIVVVARGEHAADRREGLP